MMGSVDFENNCVQNSWCKIAPQSRTQKYCRGGPAPDRLSAALVSRKFAVARARVRGPRQQADVSAAG